MISQATQALKMHLLHQQRAPLLDDALIGENKTKLNECYLEKNSSAITVFLH